MQFINSKQSLSQMLLSLIIKAIMFTRHARFFKNFIKFLFVFKRQILLLPVDHIFIFLFVENCGLGRKEWLLKKRGLFND